MTAVYIITQQTKAIMTKDSSYYKARILEGQTERYSIHKPEQILDNSCLLYGSTLHGRKEAVKEILKSSSKLPVPVIPDKGVYMLPSSSTKNKDCIWFSYYQIDFYEQRDAKTYVAFNDGTGIYANVSRSAFDSQFKRTSQIIAHQHRSIFFGARPWTSFQHTSIR
ncbi:competence protein ComK [Virgibacillus byunsanensis]|uniref:Competence protein ComK n=1 Tax=Virgibacillus byunsanensis TaxID=570945 RepID=A0ABW3LG86_9BACI